MSNPFLKLLVLFSVSFFCICCGKEEELKKERTVLVYMAADNNLSSEVSENIKGMKEGISKMKALPGYFLVFKHCRNRRPELVEFYISGTEVKERILKEYKNENSATVDMFLQVVKDVRTIFKTPSYGLVMWSHGSGWLPHTKANIKSVGLTASPDLSLFPHHAYFGEDGENNGMEISDLAEGIGNSKPFAFILFDACLMSSIESLYAMRNNADYFIASPADIISTGHPYKEIVKYFWGGKEDYEKICRAYFDYYNNQSGDWQSAATALVDSRELENLAVETAGILKGRREEIQSMETEGIMYYFSNLNNYKPHFFDFGEFIKKMATPAQYGAFKNILDKAVCYKRATPYFFRNSEGEKYAMPVEKYSGLNTYIPSKNWGESYNTIYFSSEWAKKVYTE